MESQFRDVTSDVIIFIILVVHVVAPRSGGMLGTANTASLSAGYSSTGQMGGTQSAL